MSELFNGELNLTNDPSQWEVIQQLRNLQGLTIEFLSKLIADLSPVMQIEAMSRMPSTYWAYRLYGDANRDEELWLRNEIKHPMWMPVEFEALVR
jgi:prophage DNA circulation protein